MDSDVELWDEDTGDSNESVLEDNQFANLPEEQSLEEKPLVEATLPVKPTKSAENFTVEEDLPLVSAWLETSMDAEQDNEQSHGRAESFTEKEDNLLVLAWLNTSVDAGQDNEQSRNTYWQIIHGYFHAHKDFESDRDVNSLMLRWDTIVESVDRFCGWYAQIQQSSMSEEDKVLQACQLYKEKDRHDQPFSFLHCWNILRQEQKWNHRSSQQKTVADSSQGSRTSGSSDSSDDDDDDEEEDDLSSETTELENWWAKKKEAEELKENERKARHDQLIALQRKGVELERERNELQRKRLELEAKDLERRRTIQDDRIMSMDLSGMSEKLKQFYLSLQREIFARRIGGGSG